MNPPVFTSRSAVKLWMEELTKSVLESYDSGHNVYIFSYYKNFVIGGKNKPLIIIEFTDSNKDHSIEERLKDIQIGG